MSDQRLIRIACPYCDARSEVLIARNEERRPKVILCEPDNGEGCDRYFAAEVDLVPRIKTYTMVEVVNAS